MRIKTNSPFCSDSDYAGKGIKKKILICGVRERFDTQTGRCTCVLCFHDVVSALCELKEAVDHSLETQTVCAVQ